MAIDVNKVRRAREETKAARKEQLDKNNVRWTVPEGQTLVYVCPPLPAMDDLPEVEIAVHYSVGPRNLPVACLDPATNPILYEEPIASFLKRKGINLTAAEGCPIDLGLENPPPSIPDEKLDRMENKETHVYALIPWARIDKSGNRVDLPENERIPRILPAGPKIHDGISDVIAQGGDITDPERASLVLITREGTGFNTKYKADADIETIRSPIRIPKPQRFAMSRACIPGGECDPHHYIAVDLVRSYKDADALFRGAQVQTQASPESNKPPCFGFDANADDPDCRACRFKADCAAKCGRPVPPDAEGAAPAPAPAASTPAPAPAAQVEAPPATTTSRRTRATAAATAPEAPAPAAETPAPAPVPAAQAPAPAPAPAPAAQAETAAPAAGNAAPVDDFERLLAERKARRGGAAAAARG